MKRQLTSILLFSALLVGGASTFVSCKDNESDSVYETNSKIAEAVAKHAKDIEDLANKLQAESDKRLSEDEILKGLISNAASDAAAAAQKAQAAMDKANANATKIGEIEAKLLQIQSTLESYASLSDKLNDLQEQINNIKPCTCDLTDLTKKYTDLAAKLAEDEARIAAIEAGKTTLQEQLNKINSTLDKKADQTDLESLRALVTANAGKIADNTAAIEALSQKVANIITADVANQKFADLYDKYDNLNNKIDNVNNKIEDVNGKVNGLGNKVDGLGNKIEGYDQKFTDIDAALAAIRTSITDASNRLKGDITALDTRLTEQMNNLFNAMASMVTSFDVQAYHSPVLGYYHTFAGDDLRLMGAYFGTSNSNAKIGDVKIRKGTTLIDQTSGENAGVIYAYINPANKDFTGLKFRVVDSQGNATPFTATAVKTSRVLTYGYTRGASEANSNLYAFKLNIDAKDAEDAQTWTSADAAALKEVGQSVLNELKDRNYNFSLSKVASSLYKVLNNRLTAYHLELVQNVEANGKSDERVIVSNKDFAATTFQPLSYKFLEDGINVDLPKLPAIQSKINFNNYKFNWDPISGMENITTNVTLEGIPDINSIKINGVVIPPTVTVGVNLVGTEHVTGTLAADGHTVVVDLSSVSADATVTLGDIKINPNDVHVSFDRTTETYKATIPTDEFNRIIDDVNRQVGNMVQNVNGMVDKVNNFCASIDNNYISRVNGFVNKFKNLLTHANTLLQPTMFYIAGNDSWGQLPTEKLGASYLKLNGGKASTIFVATSYTAELLAPAYKKYVYVSDKPAGATVTGTNLGKTVNGDVHKFGFEADKEGVYEITYETIDYVGVKVEKKFYVKVVK